MCHKFIEHVPNKNTSIHLVYTHTTHYTTAGYSNIPILDGWIDRFDLIRMDHYLILY